MTKHTCSLPSTLPATSELRWLHLTLKVHPCCLRRACKPAIRGAGDNSIMEEFHLLVSLPSDLATLALIILLPGDGASACFARGAPEDVLTCSARALRLWQLDTVRQVKSLQPGGGPLVAYSVPHDPTGHAAVHVVCHKSSAVATFRALAALKQQLQLKVSKECMRLRLSVQDLQSAVQHVLLQTLAHAGWSQLSHDFLLRAPCGCLT